MKRFRIDQVYHCSEDTYWDKLFDNEVRRERERKGCGTLRFDVIESRWEGDTYHQVLEMEEMVDAHAAVQKIFGRTQVVRETVRWVKGSQRLHIEYRPSIMTDRVHLTGVLSTSPTPEGHTRVVIDLEITAKVFLIGSLVEGLISKALPKRQAKDVAYFNAHQAG